ncbi:MAG: hypothetical protein EKK63_02525 [Acinetobacter sp.]|uniref:deoxynucleotide monophosphate kinase family protein n=1 Tax=Acinetobacter sp. TaxID=472 RepID=UPI000F91F962|nr:hypothetical protein [Acinetobacter sp.]RUP42192.1 MAG: hypothetical protein EKK63_02525 [Acinetobacter sp.]
MIIAINGRIGHGKDTVGKLIQQFLVQHNSFWAIKKFAGKLKTIAFLLTGVPEEKFEDQEFLNSEMPSCWNYEKQTFEYNEDGNDGFTIASMTYGKFLQKLDIDAIQDGLHSETWVNALFADYIPKKSKNEEEEYESRLPNWIITDLRFPNEFDAVKSKGGICIRVKRKDSNDTRKFNEVPNWNHPSETALDYHHFDYVINNSGTIEDLVIEVQKMLQHFKLIPDGNRN